MAFKTSCLCLALLAIALLDISSNVVARDLAEKSSSEETVGGAHAKDVKYYGTGGYSGDDDPLGGNSPSSGPSPGGGDGGGGGYKGGYPGGDGYGGYGRGSDYGHCRYGCCGHSYFGGCRCCTYPGEAAVAEIENKP